MPHYKEHYRKLKEQYGERFEMIGISLDVDPQVAIEFCREHEIPWMQICEPGLGWESSLARHFGVNGIPRTIIIGSDGRVRNTEARALNFLDGEVRNVFAVEERKALED